MQNTRRNYLRVFFYKKEMPSKRLLNQKNVVQRLYVLRKGEKLHMKLKNMKKTLWLLGATLLTTCSLHQNTYAASALTISLNNQPIAFPDAKPFINGESRTMVPIRFVSQNLGYRVIWDDTKQEVRIDDGTEEVKLIPNSKKMWINGDLNWMDTLAINQKGRVFVPIRFVTQALHQPIEFVAKSNEIKMTSSLTAPVVTAPSIVTSDIVKNVHIQGTVGDGESIYYVIEDKLGYRVEGRVSISDAKTFSFQANVFGLADGTLTLKTYAEKNGAKSKGTTATMEKKTVGPIVTHAPLSFISFNNESAYTVSGNISENADVTVTLTDSENHVATKTRKDVQAGDFSLQIDTSALNNESKLDAVVTATNNLGNQTSFKTYVEKNDALYNLDANEQEKWHIYNDGTHPADTTEGINTMLQWTTQHGIQKVTVPAGTYTIQKSDDGLQDANGCIEMVSNMTFSLDDEAIIKREAGSTDESSLVCVRNGVENVVVEGGQYEGSSNTLSENGFVVDGANNVIIQAARIQDLSGSAVQVKGGTNVKVDDNRIYRIGQSAIDLQTGNGATVLYNRVENASVGIAVENTYGTDAVLYKNLLENASLSVKGSAIVEENDVRNAQVTFQGAGIHIQTLDTLNTSVLMDSSEEYGITGDDLVLSYDNDNNTVINPLVLNGKPVRLSNVSMVGKANGPQLSGNVEDGSVFENFYIDYNADYTIDLPRGHYTYCAFYALGDGNEGIAVSKDGDYSFSECTIKGNQTAMTVDNEQATVSLQYVDFVQKKTANVGEATVDVKAAQRFSLVDSTIDATTNQNTNFSLVKIGTNDEQGEATVHDVLLQNNRFYAPFAMEGVTTIDAGIDAPAYTISDNVLYNATIHAKENDILQGNQENVA